MVIEHLKRHASGWFVGDGWDRRGVHNETHSVEAGLGELLVQQLDVCALIESGVPLVEVVGEDGLVAWVQVGLDDRGIVRYIGGDATHEAVALLLSVRDDFGI